MTRETIDEIPFKIHIEHVCISVIRKLVLRENLLMINAGKMRNMNGNINNALIHANMNMTYIRIPLFLPEP